MHKAHWPDSTGTTQKRKYNLLFTNGFLILRKSLIYSYTHILPGLDSISPTVCVVLMFLNYSHFSKVFVCLYLCHVNLIQVVHHSTRNMFRNMLVNKIMLHNMTQMPHITKLSSITRTWSTYYA